MKKFVLKKLLSSFVLLILITMAVFALTHMQPGNPYLDRLGPDVSAEQFEQMLVKLGYYDPIWLKYLKWLRQVISGDLGYSIKHGQPVIMLIKKYLSHSIVLVSVSFVLSSIAGIAIGIKAGGGSKWFKNIVQSSSIALLSLPSFFMGILFIKWFAYDLKLLPASGMYSLKISSSAPFVDVFVDRIAHMILPVAVLMLMNIPAIVQFTMTNMERELRSDYIRTAKSKGIGRKAILWKHAFRNMAIPIVALLSLQAPMVFSGAMITETIFSYPGMGKLGFDAVLGRDYPLIMGVLLVNTVVVVVVNFCADFIYALIDPRIRLVKGSE